MLIWQSGLARNLDPTWLCTYMRTHMHTTLHYTTLLHTTKMNIKTSTGSEKGDLNCCMAIVAIATSTLLSGSCVYMYV